MSDVIVYTVAFLITLPLPFLVIFYLFARKWSRHKLKALHRTANYTAPVFILSVHVLLIVLFERSFLPFIIVFLLFLLGLSMVAQYKINDEVRLFRALKGFWRVSFLLFILFYMGLSTYGLVARVFFI